MVIGIRRDQSKTRVNERCGSPVSRPNGLKHSASPGSRILKNPAAIGIALLCLSGAIAISVSLLGSDGLEIATADQGDKPSMAMESSGAPDKRICVHVTGNVAAPGVVSVPADARVVDAIEAAGGFTDDADTEAINLARTLSDGEQIVVPSIAQQPTADLSQDGRQSETPSSSSAYIGSKLNINKATQGELESLSGIGPSIAARIIEDREANGPFTSTQDIMRVSGIGSKKFERIENSICIG